MISGKPDVVRRARRLFHLEVGAFIIIVSFLYGLSSGLTRKLQTAQASFGGVSSEVGLRSEDYISQRLSLRDGLTVLPIGNEIAINGKVAEAVMFYSNLTVPSVVQGQISRWREKGVTAYGRVSRSRGVGIGVDRISGEKYSIVAWIVPPTVRRIASNGFPVQGFINVSSSKDVAQTDATSGEVPGVPLMSGGKGGSIFSSMEQGEPSYTGVYTNPGSISESFEFYRNALAGDGWQEVVGDARNLNFGFLKFSREGAELDLLFSLLAEPGGRAEQGEKTVVVVSVHPAEQSARGAH